METQTILNWSGGVILLAIAAYAAINGTRTYSTTTGLPYNVTKMDNVSIFSDTFSCFTVFDDAIAILRMKVRC